MMASGSAAWRPTLTGSLSACLPDGLSRELGTESPEAAGGTLPGTRYLIEPCARLGGPRNHGVWLRQAAEATVPGRVCPAVSGNSAVLSGGAGSLEPRCYHPDAR